MGDFALACALGRSASAFWKLASRNFFLLEPTRSPADCTDELEQTRPSVTTVGPAMMAMLPHADISPSPVTGCLLHVCWIGAGRRDSGSETKLFSAWLSANECSSLPVIPGSCLCFIPHLVSLQAGDHELPDLPSGCLLFSACAPTRALIRQATEDLAEMLDHCGSAQPMGEMHCRAKVCGY